MKILGFLPLIGIALAVSATAQTAIPTLLQPERAISIPETTDNPFPGNSSVAGNGKDFLIVTAQDHYAGGSTHALMLVDSDGRPLPPSSILFPFSLGLNDGVASNGHDFLAAFGGHGATTGVRVSADGALMDSTPIIIHASTRPGFSEHDTSGARSVAWDGSQYVVLTTIERLTAQKTPTASLHGPLEEFEIVTRVGVDGQILQNDLEVDRGVNNAIAARNGISVMAWSAGGVFIRTMTGAGSLSDPNQISLANARAISIAAGDDGFLLVWSEGVSNTVRTQHLDPGGLPDAPSLTVSVASGPDLLAVTWDGAAYRVAWSSAESKTIESTRVNAAGVEASAATLANGGGAALAFNGESTLLAWNDSDLGTRARPAEIAGAGQLVHRFFNPQSLNAIGFTPGGPSVAWTEGTSRLTNVSSGASSPQINDGSYTFIRGLNRPLIISGTTAPFTFRYADGSGQPFALPTKKPFWIGSAFLCLWTDPAPVTDPFAVLPLYAQRFDAIGAPIDGTPRQIGTSYSLSGGSAGPAALYEGVFAGASASEALVAYVDPSATLRGVLIVDDNQFIDIGVIASPQDLANPIAITSDGHDSLVTWISGMNGTNSFIASRRVLADGSMPAASRIDSPGNDTKDSMETFWTGQNYLVVWSKRESYGQDHELWALRLRRDGTLIDYPPQRIGSISGEAPKWAYQNGVLAIAWQRDPRVYSSVIGIPRRRAVTPP
ncbi:MAG TPA: hypothetical protein VNN08_11365 [Thermoanaerobaculia bacterium]|nr:hypothetical protein [Thermoanaerobaculia bacterium]